MWREKQLLTILHAEIDGLPDWLFSVRDEFRHMWD